MRRVTLKAGLISFVVFAMLAGVAPMAAAGASPKAAGGLGAAAGFAVLADGTGLTCTGSTVTGPVGVSSSSTAITQTGCTLTVQVAPGAYAGFLTAYSGIAGNLTPCKVLTGTLAGVTLKPGTYCFDAAATLTGTLTLTGTGPWLFEIGTSGTGALTATNFTVVGSNPCNVTWWVRQAVTLTTSAFQGTILAGTDITLTGTTLTGRALATGAVTMTDSHIVGCTGTGKGVKQHCNQGVGNGPEGCDPGNSNQGDAARSNDELGGIPGHPGRQGGNHNANVQAKGNSTLHSNAPSK
jgi:Ice-binding-like